jgi:hypothetical protein
LLASTLMTIVFMMAQFLCLKCEFAKTSLQ